MATKGKAGENELARQPARNSKILLAEENVVADRGDLLQVPARRHIARMEEQRVADRRILEVLVDNLRDRHRGLPLAVAVRDVRQRAAMEERELAALEQHAAIGRREAPAAVGAVGDHLTDCQLAGERLALGLEINPGGEAFELATSGFGTTEIGYHRSEIF